MDLHTLLYQPAEGDIEKLNGIQLVISAAELRRCFDQQEQWIRRVIREAQQPEYYSRKEVADLLHVTVGTVDRYAEAGMLPKPVRSGRRVLFEKAATNYSIKNKMPPSLQWNGSTNTTRQHTQNQQAPYTKPTSPIP